MSEHPHGSRERYEAGCECDGCRLCMILHTKAPVTPTKSTKQWDAAPYGKLLRALLREGYTLRQLAQRADYSAAALRNIALGVTVWIYPSTAEAIERLIATLPSEQVSA